MSERWTPQSWILHEFSGRYNLDELPPLSSGGFDEGLAVSALASGSWLRQEFDEVGRKQATSLLRAAAADPAHPLNAAIEEATLIDWRDDDAGWQTLQELLRRIADAAERGVEPHAPEEGRSHPQGGPDEDHDDTEVGEG